MREVRPGGVPCFPEAQGRSWGARTVECASPVTPPDETRPGIRASCSLHTVHAERYLIQPSCRRCMASAMAGDGTLGAVTRPTAGRDRLRPFWAEAPLRVLQRAARQFTASTCILRNSGALLSQLSLFSSRRERTCAPADRHCMQGCHRARTRISAVFSASQEAPAPRALSVSANLRSPIRASRIAIVLNTSISTRRTGAYRNARYTFSSTTQ